ncbi:penicillin amidase [Cnuella takakiae]|uniref:Penicillin amidase n=1 Tax=Cnuella takakiae TaxID=1302690 RepID=A0A1M5GJF0_9BACT|nr:penicillin acylase family protein [Cnuella takakiae]OLY92440.1 penicillin acylase family protein [Cnuella takakiae]SHG03875.1 penicillin amidase [Cnuella takakiae]
MRILPFLVSTTITIALVIGANNKWGGIPPLGRFLSPQQGFWQNAEAADHSFSGSVGNAKLQGRVDVHFDSRLVPHVFAEVDRDAFFVQGYLHARFRLWQMDFQTRAAAGRISEVLGNDPRYLRYDRDQRRMGMVYAAEASLAESEKDPMTREVMDAYTAGVNAYIETLTESSLPIEYKLLDYQPERWSNLKSAIFLKLMSNDLAGRNYVRDIEFSNVKSIFGENAIGILYPQLSDSSHPIVPKGTRFDTAGVKVRKPATADSLYFQRDTAINAKVPQSMTRLNGSNNWAVDSSRSASGHPMLANDPHLGLSFPSIWYEMQLHTPEMNVYGVSFPGTPSIAIGFNDSIAFGFTNAGRDVGEYYKVRFRDGKKDAYWFNGKWEPTRLRVEQIAVRGSATISDTVAYTIFGPVLYDQSFASDDIPVADNTGLAFRWMAHEPSNDLQTFIKLDKAKNYTDYRNAIKTYACPAQNMLFAAKSGGIAIWQQGRFPALWKGQGLYVMPGEDSSYLWQAYIPSRENPHVINPKSGYIQSANQRPVDSAYPYFIPGDYFVPRSVSIDSQLAQLKKVSVKDMMRLQNSNHDYFAAMAVPLLVRYADAARLNATERRLLTEVSQWNFVAEPESESPTIFKAWWSELDTLVWSDEFARIKQIKSFPDDQTLLERLLRDSAFGYVDNINTPQRESLQFQVTAALRNAAARLQAGDDGMEWWKEKNTSIYHLLRTAVTPFARTGLKTGGWKTALNAQSATHGPSWRMIVHLSPETEAYGVYPGGQSGNPGSRFYDNLVDTWAAGKYYRLWVMKKADRDHPRVKWTLTFQHI